MYFKNMEGNIYFNNKSDYFKFRAINRGCLPVVIEKVIFNEPATIVFWSDKTKTVVKAENDTFDPEKGLAMAIAKKSLGNQGNYYNTFKKWLPKEPDMDAMDTFAVLCKTIKGMKKESLIDDVTAFSINEVEKICKLIIKEINTQTDHNLKYGLCLADYDRVKDMYAYD